MQTLALVGAAGGTGTTRLAVEVGATLARAGRDVAVVDAAFGTQGLADYVPGRIGTDVTGVATSDDEIGDALVDLPAETPGRLALAPARAPFERLARAKTAGAAERFEQAVAAAGLSHDTVIVDTPPVAANQAVAAVNAADRVAAVTTDTARGADAFARLRARLDDIQAGVDSLLVNFAADDPVVEEADARIPESDVTAPEECPACLEPDDRFAPAVAAATETALDRSLDLEFPDSGRLDGLLGR
jgi:cellulose biosynthesis protein BcsQ